MNDRDGYDAADLRDSAPGEELPGHGEPASGILGYALGFGLAVLLTTASFYVAGSQLIWGPSIPVLLVVLAIAQMGVHLAFFLHITTSPDNTNNVLALAFGALVIFLIIFGSVWIMAHLGHHQMTPAVMMQHMR